MSLRGFLNVKNAISVTKTISTDDGMGGTTSVTTITNIPLCALWQNGSNNRWTADKYAKDSTHTLCFEYGAYTFGDKTNLTSTQAVIETIQYKNENYKLVGFPDNVMNLNEIIMQSLERTS